MEANIAENSLTSIFHRRLSDHLNDGVIFIDTDIEFWDGTEQRKPSLGVRELFYIRIAGLQNLFGCRTTKVKRLLKPTVRY